VSFKSTVLLTHLKTDCVTLPCCSPAYEHCTTQPQHKPIADVPVLLPLLLLLLSVQNAYRIFYPLITDIPGLQADVNPWYSQVCQALPLDPPPVVG
jgi:hypothetical protein